MNKDEKMRALLAKVTEEQAKYRAHLLTLPPEQILENAFQFATREDICIAMENIDLKETQIDALLAERDTLSDLYATHDGSGAPYMESIEDTISTRADELLKLRPPQKNKRGALLDYMKEHWMEPQGQAVFVRLHELPEGDLAGIATLYDEVFRVERAVPLPVPLYYESISYARDHGELDAWRVSQDANSACRDAIDRFIGQNYQDNHLHTEGFSQVVQQFGFQRVAHVLAGTIQQKSHDGRISLNNKVWAKNVPCAQEIRDVLGSHSGLIDLIANKFRQLEQELAQDRLSIYQLKPGDATRDYRFEPLDRIHKNGLTIDPAHYELIYTAPLAMGETLDGIYERFNLDRPADFTGHSLSVSDIIVLRQDGKDAAYYVDRIGFAEVPEFLGRPQEQAVPAPGKEDNFER